MSIRTVVHIHGGNFATDQEYRSRKEANLAIDSMRKNKLTAYVAGEVRNNLYYSLPNEWQECPCTRRQQERTA